jgi:DNA-binding response OmpR family regulator
MTKPLVMIVEDDPKLGIIYEAALKQAGYDTYLDKDGDQIMDKLSSVDPALIILDMHLPYASGADILRQIRSNKRWAKIPVIVATADLFAAKSLQNQAEYVLVKPVGVGRLLEIASQLRDKIAENSSNDLDK